MVEYSIMFADKPEAYHSTHRLLDAKTHKCYCEDLEFHYLEIPKLRRLKKTPQTGLERMLSYMGSIGGAEGMKKLAAVDSDIERILKLEEIFVTDPQQWVGYLRRERAQSDYTNSLLAKLEEGKRRGIQQGLLEGKLEIARNMLKRGMTADVIAEMTGLDGNEIRAIIK